MPTTTLVIDKFSQETGTRRLVLYNTAQKKGGNLPYVSLPLPTMAMKFSVPCEFPVSPRSTVTAKLTSLYTDMP